MIKITELRKTCNACPAQWEGKLDDGRAVYIRYRWGVLTIDAGDTIDEAIAGQHNILIVNSRDGMGGFMTLADLKEFTKPREWPVIEWPETDGTNPDLDDNWLSSTD